MKRFGLLLAASVCICSAHTIAQAADMPPAPQAARPAASAPAEEWGTSWYLRGDIAWSSDNQPLIGATLTYTGLTGQRAAWAGDIGFGYHINNWLRADVTYGVRQQQNGLGSANITHSEILANAYIDIGTWGGFTPFVGAGVGQARRVGSAPLVAGTKDATLAFALMVGVGWNLSTNIKLDLGYRYIDMGAINGTIGGVAFRQRYNSHEARLGVRYMID